MGLDLNNRWKFTRSQKIGKNAYISSLIAEKIDNNADIKRLMRYNTIDPLVKKSKNYEGKTIIQKDLKDSLRKTSMEVLNFNNEPITSEQCLFTKGFNEDVVTDDQNYIFIENNYNNYNSYGDFMATMNFRVHVLVPCAYMEVKDSENDIVIERAKAIASLIDDMLDKYIVDDDVYSKLVGNIQFDLKEYYESRLSKTDNVVVASLSYEVKMLKNRVDNYV